jgi:hypothetical protein
MTETEYNHLREMLSELSGTKNKYWCFDFSSGGHGCCLEIPFEKILASMTSMPITDAEIVTLQKICKADLANDSEWYTDLLARCGGSRCSSRDNSRCSSCSSSDEQ